MPNEHPVFFANPPSFFAGGGGWGGCGGGRGQRDKVSSNDWDWITTYVSQHPAGEMLGFFHNLLAFLSMGMICFIGTS